MTDPELLSKAIDVTGLTVRQFARLIVRDARNVYRWLKGDNDLPQPVRERCQELLADDPADARRQGEEFILREVRRRPKRGG